MLSTRKFASLAVVAIVFTGCSSSSATSTARPAGTDAPTAAATLTVAFEENAQVELTAPSGQRILIDVYDPSLLTTPAVASDIVLVSHGHSDHSNADFEATFTGQKLINKTTDLNSGDIKIKSIAASHDDAAIDATGPTNHIFVIELAGFKIVHMGSTGQLQLTSDQLAAIGGDVDIAIGALQNVGGADPNNRKQIDIMNQIHPKIVIATHSTLDYVSLAAKEWKATFSSKKSVTIPHNEIPAQTTLLSMGIVAPSYGVILNAPESNW